ncbi:MAG: c-type cytochrome [Planctomycetes bacterium]|nr:c-type cytochrome [Planctomycetota bacterium]
MRRMIITAACVALFAGPAMRAPAQEEYKLEIPAGLPKMRIPRDNPLTKEKVELGKQLYFDKRLSQDSTVSCASCHDPAKGWSNAERFATGFQKQQGGRNSPTVVNAGYHYFQFWDGRAKHVEGQALGPIQNPIEMAMEMGPLVERLNKIPGYREQFQEVFGTDVTEEGVAKAIGAFERTLLAGDAPYDRYEAGDEDALSESAKRGMDIFFNKAQCSGCHAGPLFTDGGFHNIGVSWDKEEPDLGRFTESNLEGDKGSFKTPGLRDVALTAPYMHDGSMATLEEVVEHYNKGGVKNPYLDEAIFPLNLTEQEKSDLVAFLKEGLTSTVYPQVKPPELPPDPKSPAGE